MKQRPQEFDRWCFNIDSYAWEGNLDSVSRLRTQAISTSNSTVEPEAHRHCDAQSDFESSRNVLASNYPAS